VANVWLAARKIVAVYGWRQYCTAANDEASAAELTSNDVVLAIAASGESRWTCEWLSCAKKAGSVAIGIANNADSTLLKLSE